MSTTPVLNPPLVIRPMGLSDLEAATELSRDQQWPHREEDWEMFLDLGEGLVAERDGTLLGTTLAWRYGEDMATVGLVIVNPASQGQGIGRQLMEAMLDQLGDRTTVLNATDEGLPLYRKLGYVDTGLVHQHQGAVQDVPLAELAPGYRVRPKGKTDAGLATLYSAAAGMDRDAMFGQLAANSRTVVLTHDNVPVGFAMLRRFGRGWSIGPVVAPDEAGAKALILHWLSVKKGKFCRLDITDAGGLQQWLEDIGLPLVGSVRTMARGRPPEPSSGARMFALAAQSLG